MAKATMKPKATQDTEKKIERDPVSKVIGLLRWMVDQDAETWGVREVAGALEMTPSTAHRTLTLLARQEMLEQDLESNRYRLGIEFYRLAHQATSRFQIANVAQEILEDLVLAVNETAYLIAYHRARKRMLIMVKVDCDHPVRHSIETHRWVRVYPNATGIALLAFLPEHDQQELLTEMLLPDHNRRSNRHEIDAVVKRARERGYAVARSIPYADYYAVAAPVFGPKGDLLAIVNVAIPDQRFIEEDEMLVAQKVIECAELVSNQLN